MLLVFRLVIAPLFTQRMLDTAPLSDEDMLASALRKLPTTWLVTSEGQGGIARRPAALAEPRRQNRPEPKNRYVVRCIDKSNQ